MEKWILIAIASLAGISIFSLYVGVHLAKGILCNYVYLTPYALPIAYVMGFFLGYAIPQIKASNPNHIIELFEKEEKLIVEAAIRGKTQAEIARKIGKVKAHRLIKEMERKGIIEREQKGNTFLIKPGKKLLRVLK